MMRSRLLWRLFLATPLLSLTTMLNAQVAMISIVKLTNGSNNNSPPGPSVPVGSTVTFTYTVTNPGNVALSNVFVRDDAGTPGNIADDFDATFVGGDMNANGLLDVGETWTFTASSIATAGQYTNAGRASGTAGGTTVTASDPDNHFGAVGGINLVKFTNGTDNNSPPGPSVPVGSTVTFTYIVTNTGNAALSNVIVTDDAGTPGIPGDDFNPSFVGGDTNANGRLDLTETWTYLATRVATLGQYTNTAVASATVQGTGIQVASSNPDNHLGVVFTVTPTATATATQTATATVTSTPTATATATSTASATPTTTSTAIGGGGPATPVPTLSFGMLALLGVALLAAGYFVIRRSV